MEILSLIVWLQKGRHLAIHVSTWYQIKSHILVFSIESIVTVVCLITSYSIISKYTQGQKYLPSQSI